MAPTYSDFFLCLVHIFRRMPGTPQEVLPVNGREASAPWGRAGYSSAIFLRCLDPLPRTAPCSEPLAATSAPAGAFTEILATGGINDFPYARFPHRFDVLGSEIPTVRLNRKDITQLYSEFCLSLLLNQLSC